MDFFEEQERARSRTGWLILLFGLAVCGTVMAVYAAMRLALQYAFGRPLLGAFGQFWNGDLFWRVAANTVALIAAVSFFKIRALSASADSVVLGLGGQLLDPNTNDPHQRRLLNVVEEMAIASEFRCRRCTSFRTSRGSMLLRWASMLRARRSRSPTDASRCSPATSCRA